MPESHPNFAPICESRQLLNSSETIMAVIRPHNIHPRRAIPPAILAVMALTLAAVSLCAQGPNPSSATNPYFGSITLHQATEETLKLSLDEAIALGLKNNLGLKEAESGEKLYQGEKNEALQEFLPTLVLTGATG